MNFCDEAEQAKALEEIRQLEPKANKLIAYDCVNLPGNEEPEYYAVVLLSDGELKCFELDRWCNDAPQPVTIDTLKEILDLLDQEAAKVRALMAQLLTESQS